MGCCKPCSGRNFWNEWRNEIKENFAKCTSVIGFATAFDPSVAAGYAKEAGGKKCQCDRRHNQPDTFLANFLFADQPVTPTQWKQSYPIGGMA